MTTKRMVTLQEVQSQLAAMVVVLNRTGFNWPGVKIYGIPRGGIPVAMMLAAEIGGELVDDPRLADFIVDDIYDSGRTMEWLRSKIDDGSRPYVVMFDKRKPEWAGQWLVMPWEATETKDHSADDIVIRLLEFIGEDPTREGLRETPARVVKAWSEWASGYKVDPASLFKTFEDGKTDELVVVHNIPVVSKCEHHLADIIGIAHVGYVPNGKIVGLSKLARLVNCFAHRLQVQERLTSQIADTLMQHLSPLGAGVLVRAAHHCMSTRGVRVHGSVTTTSAMRGVLLEKPEARAEFLTLCQMAEREI